MGKIIKTITILANIQKHKWKRGGIFDPLTSILKCVISHTHTACVIWVSFSQPQQQLGILCWQFLPHKFGSLIQFFLTWKKKKEGKKNLKIFSQMRFSFPLGFHWFIIASIFHISIKTLCSNAQSGRGFPLHLTGCPPNLPIMERAWGSGKINRYLATREPGRWRNVEGWPLVTTGIGMSLRTEMRPQACKLWNSSSYVTIFLG